MNNIKFSPRSKIELIDAWGWYESRQKGLGDKFLSLVEEKLITIAKYPKRFPVRSEGFRETLINKFPYAIIYFIEGNSIIISSIFNSSRNPKGKYS